MKANTVFAMKPAKVVHNRVAIDPDLLIVENNFPVPAGRRHVTGKYDAVFSKLKPGGCIKCEPDEAPVIATALVNSIKRDRLKALTGCKVKFFRNRGDGHGGVFVLKP